VAGTNADAHAGTSADNTETKDLGELQVVTEETPAPKKRKRKFGWFIALGVLVLLIVGAWIVGDFVARDYAEGYVRDQVRSAFQLEPDKEVDVVIGPGSLIGQAITGSIDSVDVSIDEVAFGPVEGNVKIAMTGIPLSADAPVDTFRVGLVVPEENLAGLTSYITAADVESIALVDDRVALETEFSVFGFAIPVGVQITPVVVDGEIGFEPSVISVNGAEVSVADLKSGPFASLAESLLSTQTFCVASSLPAALTVTDVTVSGPELRINLEADDTALGGTGFTAMGECAAE